jgi:hypothetical protein
MSKVVVRGTARYSVYEEASSARKLESCDLVRAYGRQYWESQERLETLQLVMRAHVLSKTRRKKFPNEVGALVSALRRGYSMSAVAKFLLEGQPCVIASGPVPVDAQEDMRQIQQRLQEELKVQRAALRWHTRGATLSYDADLRSFSTRSKVT